MGKTVDHSRRRHLAKTFSWRIIATTTTVLITWAITGSWAFGAAVGSVEAIAKMFLYYFHERAWYKVDFGLNRENTLETVVAED